VCRRASRCARASRRRRRREGSGRRPANSLRASPREEDEFDALYRRAYRWPMKREVRGTGGRDMTHWLQAGPSITAAFLGSLVECVEAATIVLAVGTVRGWRSALLGTAAGLALLTALVVALGPALGVVPLAVLQLVIG